MSTIFDSMEDVFGMTEWPGMKEWSAMASEYERVLPNHFGGAMNLMAHPMGAVAASTALGFGMASQGLGLWLGMLNGATESLQRARTADLPTPFPIPDHGKPAFVDDSLVATRTKAAVDTMAADAEAAAREAAKTMGEAADAVGRDAGGMAGGATAPTMSQAEVKPEDFLKPKPTDKPASPDDLKAISGIGPKLEQVLNDIGIWTYDQIAAWTSAEVAWVDDYLAFKGRVDRDGWLEQAATLGGKQ